MQTPHRRAPTVLRTRDTTLPVRIARSTLAEGSVISLDGFLDWFGEYARNDGSRVRRVNFDELIGWHFDPTGDLVHESGRFFSVRGLRVRAPDGPVRAWSQPIIDQPEIGILGILVREFDGVLHCLMQAKMEPGNRNEVQLSPTVQATRSNYTGVHRGSPVPYLEFFRDADPQRVLADVLQSEQGSWFWRKRNRNMVVETVRDVEPLPGFCWLSLGQLHRLLALDDLVNMDSRTVLSCLPFSGVGLDDTFGTPTDPLRAALVRSLGEENGALHTSAHLGHWLTAVRARTGLEATPIGLREVTGWHREADRITHSSGRFFDVVAVSVRAANREVAGWTQPLFQAHGVGVTAFLVRRIDGVLHALVQARAEPGHLDAIELAPTVQCTPANHAGLPRPRFLDDVLAAPARDVRFDTVLSEEGGRFLDTRSRYLVVEVPADRDLRDLEAPDDYRWLAVHQLVELIRHRNCVNVQARTLTACLHAMVGLPEGDRADDRAG